MLSFWIWADPSRVEFGANDQKQQLMLVVPAVGSKTDQKPSEITNHFFPYSLLPRLIIIFFLKNIILLWNRE